LEIWKIRFKIWWVCSVYFGGEFSNSGDKKIGNFLEFYLFFSVNSERKNASKMLQKWQNFSKPKILGEKRKKPGNLMLGFGGHINKHRDFTYLPALLNHFA
jgi:hypothetical protein